MRVAAERRDAADPAGLLTRRQVVELAAPLVRQLRQMIGLAIVK
jgi:hypothetical protein